MKNLGDLGNGPFRAAVLTMLLLLSRGVSAAPGDLLYAIPAPHAGHFGASVAGTTSGLVVVGAPDTPTSASGLYGAAYAFNGADGALLREFPRPATIGAPAFYFGAVIGGVGNLVVVGTTGRWLSPIYGHLMAFDASSGASLWGHYTMSITTMAPASDGELLVGELGQVTQQQVCPLGNAYKVDPATGVRSAYFSIITSALAASGTPSEPQTDNLDNICLPCLYPVFNLVASNGTYDIVGGHYVSGSGRSLGVCVYNSAMSPVRLIPPPYDPYSSLFASAVAATGDVVAATDPSYTATPVFLFRLSTGELLKQLPPPTGANGFGQVVAATGTKFVVGAPGAHDGQGATFLYEGDPGKPNFGAMLKEFVSPAPIAGGGFGSAVAATSNTAIIGEPGGEAVYVFDSTIELPPVPPAPQNLTANTISQTVIELAWTPSDLYTTLYSIERKSGSPDFAEVTTVPAGTVTYRDRHLSPATQYTYRVRAWDAAGYSPYSNEASATTLPPAGTLLATVRSPSPHANDAFGASLAVVGKKLVVGAPCDDTSGRDTGAAYVFEIPTGAFVAAINNPSPVTGDRFGSSLAPDAHFCCSDPALVERVYVGAPLSDLGTQDAGAIFQCEVNTGAHVQTVPNPFPARGERFGSSVASLPQYYVAGGAPYSSVGARNAGRAYSILVGGTPSILANPTPVFGDSLGFAMAAIGQGNGNQDDCLIAVGAPNKRVYARNEGTVYTYAPLLGGTLKGQILNPHASAGDLFGRSLAANGFRLLVGAPGTLGRPRNSGSGAAYLFDGRWGTLQGTFTNPSPARNAAFGRSVAIGDRQIAIGAPKQPVNRFAAGAVYLYDRAPDGLAATIPNPTPAVNDEFGAAVAVADTYVIVSAPSDGTFARGAGTVYIYQGLALSE